MSERFQTWRVDTMVGPFATGCPSPDAAVAIAVDLMRYSEEYDEDLDEHVDRRHEVVVERDGIPDGVDCDELFPGHVAFVYPAGDSRASVGVAAETRCGCCAQRLSYVRLAHER